MFPDRAGLVTFTPPMGDAGPELVTVVPPAGATSFTFAVIAAAGNVPLIEIEISNGQEWTEAGGLSIAHRRAGPYPPSSGPALGPLDRSLK